MGLKAHRLRLKMRRDERRFLIARATARRKRAMIEFMEQMVPLMLVDLSELQAVSGKHVGVWHDPQETIH